MRDVGEPLETMRVVGTEARQGIEALLGLFVEVREHWRENETVLGEMALGEDAPPGED